MEIVYNPLVDPIRQWSGSLNYEKATSDFVDLYHLSYTSSTESISKPPDIRVMFLRIYSYGRTCRMSTLVDVECPFVDEVGRSLWNVYIA